VAIKNVHFSLGRHLNLTTQQCLILALCSACTSAKVSESADPEGLDYTLGIARIDTHDVVVDEQYENREWVNVTLEFTEGTADNPAAPNDPPTWEGFGAIHLRGNSSMQYDKKQYALETRDADGEDLDTSFFGLPEEEDWVLAAPYADKTLMRNHLMFHWSRAIGRYAPRTRFVEIFMEDGGDSMGPEDYRGLYVLTEKIKRDKHRVDVEKLRPTDSDAASIQGGYLLRRDWIEEDAIETHIYGDQILLESPKLEDVTEGQWSYIEGYLNDLEQALERGDGSHTDYADMESFADHMLMMEMSRNVDAYVLSTYMHKAREGLLKMGPIWDFNGSLGNADYFESWMVEGWHYNNPEFPADNPQGFSWYAQLLEDSDFQDLLSARWAEHRSGPWSDASLLSDISTTAALLSDAQQRNFERWPVLGEAIWPNDSDAEDRTTYAEEVDHLKSWLTQRTAWMDNQLLR